VVWGLLGLVVGWVVSRVFIGVVVGRCGSVLFFSLNIEAFDLCEVFDWSFAPD
jgi:hypothetical protein